MARVLVLLPDRDFDVTEVAVPWKLLSEAKHDVVFATENGGRPVADPLLLTGVLFGQLGAKDLPKRFHGELEGTPAFERPMRWSDVDPSGFDAMVPYDAYVEDEVTAALESPDHFERGPFTLTSHGHARTTMRRSSSSTATTSRRAGLVMPISLRRRSSRGFDPR